MSIIVTGHPSGYVGAAEEPFGDELFPTFKLVYGEPRHYIFIARSELPNQEEIGYVYVTSNIDFGKIQSVREYNDMRQENMENDDWHKKGGLTMIVQIKSIDYDLFNKEIGNRYFIKAIYIPGDMLRY
ncbi:MAG: hypothetical protein OXU51_00705 [Candidatus Poribacteria bacterium]|nr:hypothetical protein [Candidatus Poribacteria bacterium]